MVGATVVLAGLCCVALLAIGRQAALSARSAAAADTAAAEWAQITIRTPLIADTAIPIQVRAGSTFAIVLASNITTGYSWRLAEQPPSKVVRSAGSRYTAPSGRRVGQGGSERWQFEARAAGKTTLTLEYARPWEKDVAPAKRQAFAVTVE